MRVAIVNSFYPPWRGGAETYVFNLAKQLQRRGHEITVFCANPPFEAGRQMVDGISVNRLRIIGRLYGTPLIPDLLFKLAHETVDIIHANFPSPYNAYMASVVSRTRGIPAVLTWHNDLPPVTPIARVLVRTHDRLVLPLYLPQFRYVIATSELYSRTSRILREHADSVVVIPNGVDTERFNPEISAAEVRARLNLTNCRIVLFVGALTRWHRYKGLDVLMKSIALLKTSLLQLRLLVVGGGELEGEYVGLAHQLGISNHVIFAGNVPDSELPKYYACSDVLVLPSKDRSEGFGLTILEANATGKPAIGTSVGGIPSVIQNGYNGLLVPPNDPGELADVIRRTLANEDLLGEMGKNGRKFAEDHDWSIVAKQTEQLYKRAVVCPGSSSR